MNVLGVMCTCVVCVLTHIMTILNIIYCLISEIVSQIIYIVVGKEYVVEYGTTQQRMSSRGLTHCVDTVR